jgi:Flp pilus assembly protein TadD
MTKRMTKFLYSTAITMIAAIAFVAGSLPTHATSSQPDTISVIDENMLVPLPSDAAAMNNQDTIVIQGTPDVVETVVIDSNTPPAQAVVTGSNDILPVVDDSSAPSSDILPPVTASTDVDTAVNPRGEEAGVVEGGNAMGETGSQSKHSGQYYDGNALVPNSRLQKSGITGPRKVDPLFEPGQRFVVVQPGPSASSREAQFVAATRALNLGRYAAAMEMFESLYKKNHRDPHVLMGLAVSQQGAGFVESAARTYEDLLRIEPNNADALINLMGLMRNQYPSVTLQNLKDLRGKYPNNPGIPAQIAMVSADLKNYDEAIQYLEVAASMEPQNPKHIYNMAIVTDHKGDAKRAVQLYERALELDSAYASNAKALPRDEIYDRLATLRRKI